MRILAGVGARRWTDNISPPRASRNGLPPSPRGNKRVSLHAVFLLPFRQQIARTKDENRDNFREGILASFSIAYRISRLLGSDAREGCWPSQRERIRSDFWSKIDSMNDIDDRERRRGGFKKDKIDKRYR